jgi:integrase
VARASANLEGEGMAPLPDGLTPHSLRRTVASVLYALGEPSPVVMADMGHTDPALALRIYAQAMRRDEGEASTLKALVEGTELADIGRRGAQADEEVTLPEAAKA